MAQNVNSEIISIGTEILLGELTDTNSVFIARVLRDLGINLYYMTSVGDNRGRIASAVRTALSRAQVVIVCGGLGPTVDDVTRQAVADATDRGLTFHQELLDQIATRFAGFKAKMTENNRQQAYLPDDSIVIENPVGTAPAFIVEHGSSVVICLPGVPREMKFLMNESVVPYLRNRYQLGIIKAHTLKVAGIGESMLDEMIGRDLLESSNPTIGLNAHHGQVDVRITAKADTIDQATHMIADMEARLRRRIGRYIFGADTDTLEAVLTDLLIQTNSKLAVVEAGIGNTITKALQSVNGGTSVLAVSEVYQHPDDLLEAYSLTNVLSLREAAGRIAEVVHKRSGAYATLVVICQPDVDEASDSAESSVVTVYTPDRISDRVYGFGGKSEVAQSWLTHWPLSNVWRMLREKVDTA